MSEVFQFSPEVIKNPGQRNAVEKIEGKLKVFHGAGIVTNSSVVHREGENVARDLALRNVRAELYAATQTIQQVTDYQYQFWDRQKAKELARNPEKAEEITAKYNAKREEWLKAKHEGQARIFENAHDQDAIFLQALTTGEVKVSVGDTGEQVGGSMRLLPPERKKSENALPVYLIPGISCNPYAVQVLARELATRGREVVVIGYPEGFDGKVTQKFYEAVKNDPGFGPHAIFFEGALRKLMGKYGHTSIDLYGISTGAPIVGTLLAQEEWQKVTRNAVLLSPASVTNQTMVELATGAGVDSISMFLKPKEFVNVIWDDGNKEIGQDLELRNKIFSELVTRIRARSPYWENMKVRREGNIFIVSGDKDLITKSRRIFSHETKEFFSKNPQLRVIELANGYHYTPGASPDYVLDCIDEGILCHEARGQDVVTVIPPRHQEGWLILYSRQIVRRGKWVVNRWGREIGFFRY